MDFFGGGWVGGTNDLAYMSEAEPLIRPIVLNYA